MVDSLASVGASPINVRETVSQNALSQHLVG
jgi:hypothetical protein